MKRSLAGLFGRAVHLRAALYRRGLLRTRRLHRPVVSVGNLTTGGTGKTPMVAHLAAWFLKEGLRPAILSRGYRGRWERSGGVASDPHRVLGTPGRCGDEPFLLANLLPGVPVLVGRDRYRSGRLAEERFDVGIHLLDDGFQHLRLHRDVDLLLLDATDPFGGDAMLPAGRLREPPEALGRADLVVVTRSHLPFDRERLEAKIERLHPGVPVFFFHHRATGWVDVATGRSLGMGEVAVGGAVALAGVGNPEAFRADLASLGLEIRECLFFRDHHQYRAADLVRALRLLDERKAEFLATTEKDAVRLRPLNPPAGRVLALRIEPAGEREEEFTMEIARLLRERSPSELPAHFPAPPGGLGRTVGA